MIEYYDREGNPMPGGMTEWAQRFEGADDYMAYKRVALADLDIDGGVAVSTVWIGLDHSFTANTRHIFETMVFGGEHSEDTWRWCSEQHARAGHLQVVAWLLKEGDEPEQCWGHLRPDDDDEKRELPFVRRGDAWEIDWI